MKKSYLVTALIIGIFTAGISGMLYAQHQSTLEQDTKQPFPRELIMWGKETASFAQAKIDSGITQMTLPSYVPANLKPESVRVITSPISNSTTVIYTPLGVTATDNDTFEKVMSDGGMFVVYTKEKVGSTYDQGKWVEQFVNEAPTVKYLLTINGHTVVSVKGAPEKDIPSEIWILYDQPAKDTVIQTMLVSLVQSNAELEKIAKSLTD